MIAVEQRARLLTLTAIMALAACSPDATVPGLSTVEPPAPPPRGTPPSPIWQPPEFPLTPTPTPKFIPTPQRIAEIPPTPVIVRTPEVVPQLGDLVAIKATNDANKPEYVLIRQEVGILSISAGTYQKAIPADAAHTLFTHERTSYLQSNGERIEWEITRDRTRIQSTLFGINGKPKGSPGTHAHAEANRKFAGFSVDPDALMGVAVEEPVIRLFEAYPNPHHAEAVEDQATNQVLQKATGMLWIQFTTGKFRSEGVAAVIFPPNQGKEPMVTLYRINRLARNNISQFNPEEQAQMAGTVHNLNYVMMALNKKDPQRQWIPIAKIPLSEARTLINVYVVSR